MSFIKTYLKNTKYLLIDTLDQLDFCKNNGFNIHTKILSFNPYLVLNKNYNVSSPEQDIKTDYYKNLSQITKTYCGKIYAKLYLSSNDKGFAQFIAQHLIHTQNIINKAAHLKKFIKNEKLVIIAPDYSEKKINNAINGNFYDFIECFDNIKIFKLQYHDQDQNRMGRDPSTKFLKRFLFEGINSILFRIITIFCNIFVIYWPGKKILYSHENTLLKGTATYLFRKGLFLENINNNIKAEDLDKNNILQNSIKAIEPILEQYQKEIIGNYINSKNLTFIKDSFQKNILDYLTRKLSWSNYFKNKKNRVQACLIGTPRSANHYSCIEVCKNNSIITASFQHAITKEINEDILNIDVTYESNIVDKYFVYNNEAARNSKNSRFHFSQENIVGLPEDMRKNLKNKKYKKNMQSILYATTTLYCGNRGIPSRSGTSDIYKANFEINLIEKVFSKLPYQIQYKPYFSKRFPGPIIELEMAKMKNNIILNEDEVDLRYIIGNCRIIITSRATSTIGWCLLSEKPVVYIENEDNRLNTLASKAFKENLFFYDVRDHNWEQNLLNFLSLPIESIEAKWKQKEKMRKLFIEKFFGSDKTNAEKQCAEVLLNKIC